MSLTTFIEIEDVRDRFRLQFRKPVLPKGIDLKVPALSRRYTLIGTACDYLLRFYVKRLNPSAIGNPWVAEHALSSPMSPLLKDAVFDLETGKVAEFTETVDSKKARHIIDSARSQYHKYLSTGVLSDDLFRSIICLAQLDPIYRAGIVDPNLGTIHDEDIQELKNLISIVNPELFKAHRIALLNPTFGNASRLVGGADADLLIDDILIDVKTTIKLELQLHVFHQLLGYVVLNEIGYIGEIQPRLQINRAGIYYSRYGFLFSFNIEEVTNLSELPSFIEWFKKRAEQQTNKQKKKLKLR